MMHSNRKNHCLLLLAVSLQLLVLLSCSKTSVQVEDREPGEIIDTDVLQSYSLNDISQILNAFQIPDSFTLQYAVKVVSITYQTTDFSGQKIKVSGALMVPQNTGHAPILSIQHGTETKSELVASVHPSNSVEGISGLLTASMGYLTCIPDYPGFGVSKSMHPYMHAQALAKSVIDFLKAAQSYCDNHDIALNGQLFLTGYSEGGYVTLATHKEIEQNYATEFNLIASAPMAGPYDLKGTSDFMLQQLKYNYPAYIGYLIYAYNELYHWDKMDDIFIAPYNTVIPTLFDGSKTFAEINGQLPTAVSSLIKQDFITSYFNGQEEEFQSVMEENSLLDWIPSAPIHFFHGDADDVSPYQNSLTAVDSLIANGATNIQLTTIPGGTHNTASLPSLLGAIGWIDGLQTVSQGKTVFANK